MINIFPYYQRPSPIDWKTTVFAIYRSLSGKDLSDNRSGSGLIRCLERMNVLSSTLNGSHMEDQAPSTSTGLVGGGASIPMPAEVPRATIGLLEHYVQMLLAVQSVFPEEFACITDAFHSLISFPFSSDPGYVHQCVSSPIWQEIIATILNVSARFGNAGMHFMQYINHLVEDTAEMRLQDDQKKASSGTSLGPSSRISSLAKVAYQSFSAALSLLLLAQQLTLQYCVELYAAASPMTLPFPACECLLHMLQASAKYLFMSASTDSHTIKAKLAAAPAMIGMTALCRKIKPTIVGNSTAAMQPLTPKAITMLQALPSIFEALSHLHTAQDIFSASKPPKFDHVLGYIEKAMGAFDRYAKHVDSTVAPLLLCFCPTYSYHCNRIRALYGDYHKENDIVYHVTRIPKDLPDLPAVKAGGRGLSSSLDTSDSPQQVTGLIQIPGFKGNMQAESPATSPLESSSLLSTFLSKEDILGLIHKKEETVQLASFVGKLRGVTRAVEQKLVSPETEQQLYSICVAVRFLHEMPHKFTTNFKDDEDSGKAPRTSSASFTSPHEPGVANVSQSALVVLDNFLIWLNSTWQHATDLESQLQKQQAEVVCGKRNATLKKDSKLDQLQSEFSSIVNDLAAHLRAMRDENNFDLFNVASLSPKAAFACLCSKRWETLASTKEKTTFVTAQRFLQKLNDDDEDVVSEVSTKERLRTQVNSLEPNVLPALESFLNSSKISNRSMWQTSNESIEALSTTLSKTAQRCNAFLRELRARQSEIERLTSSLRGLAPGTGKLATPRKELPQFLDPVQQRRPGRGKQQRAHEEEVEHEGGLEPTNVGGRTQVSPSSSLQATVSSELLSRLRHHDEAVLKDDEEDEKKGTAPKTRGGRSKKGRRGE